MYNIRLAKFKHMQRWKHFFTECLKRSDPQNGKIICESKRFEEGSKCELKCDPGYIALDVMSTTCLFDETENDFVWDVEDERLQCTPAIGFIIGGIATNYEYINEVDFNSKNGISILTCRNQNLRFLFFNEKKILNSHNSL